MRAVNLLPRDDARNAGEAPNLIVLVSVLAAVLLTAVLAGGFLMEHSKAAGKQRTLNEKKDELAAIPPPPPVQADAGGALASDKSARKTALSTALAHRVQWDRVFRELSQVLPSDVWLSNLSAKAPISPSLAQAAAPAVGANPLAPTGLTIQGYTYSHDAVARLLTRLQVVPDLVNVQLQHSTMTKVGTRDIVSFTIGADLRGSGGSS
jgi:Tfp pilus assembly protein PilN